MNWPSDAERVAATLEPDAPMLLHQNWHHLLFLHWEIPPSELQALLPPGLDLDTFEGKAYAGLVPFTITGVRAVLTPPLPWISSFHEVNVRTYVHRNGRDPGVWFFSLDASSSIAVAAARAAYKLPYFNAEIDFAASKDPMPRVDFHSRREDPRGQMPASCRASYQPAEGAITHAAPGTLDHFLVERYILYAVDGEHTLYRARVHHQPYPIQRVNLLDLDETLVWAAGIKRPESAPIRHYAREVNVKVYPLEKC
ncbi:MAG TPA: DUF2071 domain-containing protein [Thermoanaerobaculia bacterium]|nr:DUF2071 domain-containing protein [Thermoanaerobaculia bacterium]